MSFHKVISKNSNSSLPTSSTLNDSASKKPKVSSYSSSTSSNRSLLPDNNTKSTSSAYTTGPLITPAIALPSSSVASSPRHVIHSERVDQKNDFKDIKDPGLQAPLNSGFSSLPPNASLKTHVEKPSLSTSSSSASLKNKPLYNFRKGKSPNGMLLRNEG